VKKFLIALLIILTILGSLGLGLLVSQIKISKAEIPLVTISKLLDNSETYKDKWVNCSGYLEYKEVVTWDILMPHFYYTTDEDGNLETHIGFTIIEKELFIFHLHEKTTEDSRFITIIKERSGLYMPIFPLPFWYSSSWYHENAEPNVIYPELGYAVGLWEYREVREHGNLWILEVD
jgi:hypothetical protein